MMHCPQLDADNRCRVATQLADCNVRASAAGCQACQINENPRAINVVTIGMALVQRKRLGKSTAELKKLLDNYKPDAPQAVSFRIVDDFAERFILLIFSSLNLDSISVRRLIVTNKVGLDPIRT